jgi:hypothetical protein
MKRFFRACLLLVPILLAGTSSAFAQGATTATVTGTVVDADGRPVNGAQVTLANLATGVVAQGITRDDGRYLIAGLRPGEYRVGAQILGYHTFEIPSITVSLGATERVDITLRPQAVALGAIEVIGERSSAVISRGRTGSSSVVDRATVESAPTVSRNFIDLVRLTPQLATTEGGLGASAGGRNNRYNNVQIDGAVNNDVFGLAASGTPGGQADARPITLEAIQEFQVLLAPFDVRQGGFTGASINAITRGGTNDWSGSLAYFGRNEAFIGRFKDFSGAKSPEIGEFDQFDLAFSLGGPIVRDRAHIFAAGELSRRTSPFSAILGVNTGMTPGEITQVEQLLQGYGYNPGRNDQFPVDTDSDNLFVRVDVALSPAHRVTVRHNWVDAFRDATTGGAGSTFGWSNSGYRFSSVTNSSVMQLNSNFGQGMFNEFRIGYSTIRDARQISQAFPRVSVRGVDGTAVAGPDNFSGRNALDQDVIEITNDLTIPFGRHTLTFGTSNEFFKFSNLFVRNPFGLYEFAGISQFAAGTPSRYEYSRLLPGGAERAEFPVRRYGLYVQDRWDVLDDFVLTLGIRADLTHLPQTPGENPVVSRSNIGRRTDQIPDASVQINPRVGFNWDVYGDRTTQLRGGVGLFSGRTPFVWISNAYGNTGIDYVRFTCTGAAVPAFSPDPDNQPQGCAGATPLTANEINTVDPDYKMPQILRTSLAADREIGFGGVIATLEGVYTKTMQDILYQNLLIGPAPGGDLVEGRQRYPRTPLQAQGDEIPVGDVIDITNSTEGYNYSITGQLQRPLQGGWSGNLAYTFTDAWDKNVGGSSQAISNWRFNPTAGNPNDPALARSSYFNTHRILGTGTYELKLLEQFPTLISLIYIGESGNRYTYVYTGDVNADGQNSNDLIYVPASETEIRFFDNAAGTVGNQPALSSAQSWQNLNAFIESQACLREARGTIIDRGVCSEPWSHQIDLRLAQDVQIRGSHRVSLTLDVLNFGNLLNSSWGRREFQSNETFSLLNVRSTASPVNGRVLMNPFPERERSTFIANLQSRYQFQLGARYRF